MQVPKAKTAKTVLLAHQALKAQPDLVADRVLVDLLDLPVLNLDLLGLTPSTVLALRAVLAPLDVVVLVQVKLDSKIQ